MTKEEHEERKKYYKRTFHVYEIDISEREQYYQDFKVKKRSKTGR